jgi:hypothetical protein
MTNRRPLQTASAILLLSGLLSGCSVTGLGGLATVKPGTGATSTGGTGTGAVATGTGTTALPLHNQPLEALAGVEFKPVTAANARFLSANGNAIVASGGGNAVAPTGAAMASASGAKSAVAPMATSANMAAPQIAEIGMVPGAAAVSDRAVAPQPAPMPPNGGSSGVGGASSGNVDAYYGYNFYFGGAGFGSDQQMALVSLQQAETPGATGGFVQVLTSAAAPVVKAWATDARLIHSSALLDNKGTLLPTPNDQGGGPMIASSMNSKYMGGVSPGGSGDGWALTYVSSSRSEVLTFAITPAKTTILRMHWQPLDLAPERVTTDSGAAIQKLISAIQDKNFAGDEEKSGKDYFLGFGFVQPQTGQYDGSYQKTEVVYKVPDDAQWNVSLDQVMGHVVWNLNFYGANDMGYSGGGVVMANPGVSSAGPMSTNAAPPVALNKYGITQVATTAVAIGKPSLGVMPIDGGVGNGGCAAPQYVTTGGWFNNSARGMVDAETGAVIRFTRPTRMTYQQAQYPPCAVPMMPPQPGPAGGPTPVGIDVITQTTPAKQ